MIAPAYPIENFSGAEAMAARDARFSFVCSMCEHLHAGKRKLQTNDWAIVYCTGRTCSGPLGGRGYPKYKGPLAGLLSMFCWQCGIPGPAHGITSNVDPGQMLGCCDKHMRLVREGDFSSRPASEPKKQKLCIFGNEVEV